MPCLSLERICLEVLAWSHEPYWLLQKRRMQLLPEHAANILVQLLLYHQRLRAPSQLDVFRDCLTAITISAGAGIHLDAEWLAHIGSLRQLRSLAIKDMPRLRDKALAPLTALAARLQHLDLTGCSGLTNRSLQVLGQLTGLHSLVLTGTSLQSPLLAQLTSLQRLTRLHLGGCGVRDDDVTRHLDAFSALQELDLWGCTAGDDSARHITHTLQGLQRLSMAWSKVSSALPLLPSLTYLDLSHCRLCGGCADQDYAASGMQQLEVVVLVQTEVDEMGCELLEGLLRASAPCLRVLDLTRSAAANQLPLLLALDAATRLSALSLSGTELQDDFVPALASCSSLQTLNLSLNPSVTAAGLSAALPAFAAKLQRLDLRGTGVGNTVIPLLKHLPQLQQLVLADTDISWESKASARDTANLEVGPEGNLGGTFAAGEAAGPVAQVASRAVGAPAAGWERLQLLDLTGTQLTDGGCLQLAADMAAAGAQMHAAEAVSASSGVRQGSSDNGDQPHSQLGLRVLSVGSRWCKLGWKMLKGLSQITTLQQLTLQGGWDLNDRDLRHLHPLQQLQQLHVNAVDAWVLSDGGLLQLAEQLTQLRSLTRDGRQLLHFQQQADAPAQRLAGPVDAAGISSTQAAADSHSSSSPHSIWPAGPILDELEEQPSSVLTPALCGDGRASKASPARHGIYTGVSSGARHEQGARHAGGSSPASSKAASRPVGSVYHRLAAFDERYRYSMDELLSLREQAVAPDGQAEHADDSPTGLGGALPAEIRAGGRW